MISKSVLITSFGCNLGPSVAADNGPEKIWPNWSFSINIDSPRDLRMIRAVRGVPAVPTVRAALAVRPLPSRPRPQVVREDPDVRAVRPFPVDPGVPEVRGHPEGLKKGKRSDQHAE